MEFKLPVDAKAGDIITLGVTHINGVPIDGPEPDDVEIWSFQKGQLNLFEYDPWAAKHRADPTPQRRHYSQGDLTIDASDRHLVPLAPNGALLFRLQSDDFNNHCMVRPTVPDLLEDGIRMYKDRCYLMSFDIRYVAHDPIADIEWMIPCQAWQSDGLNPPFAILIKKGIVAVQCYASPDYVPENNEDWPVEYKKDFNNLANMTDGESHCFDVYYRPSIDDPLCVVSMDGGQILAYYGPNCIGPAQGPVAYFGCYTPRENLSGPVEVTMPRIEYAQKKTIVVDPPRPTEPIPPKQEMILDVPPDLVRIGLQGSVIKLDDGDWLMWTIVKNQGFATYLALFSSANGVNWRRHDVTHIDAQGCSITQDGDHFLGYFAEKRGSEFVYTRRESSDGLNWGTAEMLDTDGNTGDIITSYKNNAIYKYHWHGEQNFGWRQWYDLGTQNELQGVEFSEVRQTYGLSFDRWGADDYFALEWLFYISEVAEGGTQYGHIQPRLARSEDRVTWKPTFGRQPMIALRPGEFDSHMIVPFTAPVVDGDLVHWYYGGSNYLHGQYHQSPDNTTRIGRATWMREDFDAMLSV